MSLELDLEIPARDTRAASKPFRSLDGLVNALRAIENAARERDVSALEAWVAEPGRQVVRFGAAVVLKRRGRGTVQIAAFGDAMAAAAATAAGAVEWIDVSAPRADGRAREWRGEVSARRQAKDRRWFAELRSRT